MAWAKRAELMVPWEPYNGALGQTFQRRYKNDFTVRLANPSLRQVLSNSRLPTKSKGDVTAVTQKGFHLGDAGGRRRRGEYSFWCLQV